MGRVDRESHQNVPDRRPTKNIYSANAETVGGPGRSVPGRAGPGRAAHRSSRHAIPSSNDAIWPTGMDTNRRIYISVAERCSIIIYS